ncbi:hypothetical protein [Curtobacterium sp. MCBD17_028]|uniref:hypothetical protein n=1 Tax=Curtobacterium sp. MCBD17_028 TaxID=2175670 RepID=UPI0011B523CE|nr:hypothetical protein [Curtobacterium sp. MCBD17_028]
MIHVVMDGSAPVWQAPLLTGVFVLAAAIIALMSLYFSDRRKLKREDQRQWDGDLKRAYLAIIGQTDEVGRVLLLVRSEGVEKLNEVTAEALRGVREQQLLLELHVGDRVNRIVEELAGLLLEIYEASFTAQRADLPSTSWSVGFSNRLREVEGRLRASIRRELRMPPR